MGRDLFNTYSIEPEPDKISKACAWKTAIGLQAVDGLHVSQYLRDVALQNIEGTICLKEAKVLIEKHYKTKPSNAMENSRTEEADKTAGRIAEIILGRGFSFTPHEYISIHKRLFWDIYDHAGKIRNHDITKREWALGGDSVIYGSASELKETLDYDFAKEREFDYKNLSLDEIIHHLAEFVSMLWKIHIFAEGNTRTTAVFLIKYLQLKGFSIANNTFARNSCYFRNALVRANYTNPSKGIRETTEYLELFLRNFLLGEKHELNNQNMYIKEISI